MERLTVKRPDGRWAIARNEGEKPRDQFEKIPKVIDRLAAYEDTGLEPEEIREVQAALAPILFGRFRDIMEAERAGRLVVLPCGVNNTTWYADKDADRVLMGYVSSYQILSDGAVYFEFTNVESDVEWVSVELPIEDFGKSVFLTREEAERVLEGGQRHG